MLKNCFQQSEVVRFPPDAKILKGKGSLFLSPTGPGFSVGELFVSSWKSSGCNPGNGEGVLPVLGLSPCLCLLYQIVTEH